MCLRCAHTKKQTSITENCMSEKQQKTLELGKVPGYYKQPYIILNPIRSNETQPLDNDKTAKPKRVFETTSYLFIGPVFELPSVVLAAIQNKNIS